MSQHPEIIAAPFTVWLAPVGTAFPAVDEEPAAPWRMLGTNGVRNYAAGGVTVSHQRQIVQPPPPAGETVATVAMAEVDRLRVTLQMLDITLEEYATVLGGNAVSTTAAGAGTAGYKVLGLALPTGALPPFAALVRGPSPYAEGMVAQYEIPSCYEGGNPTLTFSKGEVAALNVELVALPDPAATSEAMRFGRLVAQNEAPLPPPLPSFTEAPSITSDGTPAVGETLTGNDGTIIFGAVSARQWLRGGVAITGATGGTYTLVSADAGANITFRVTATGPGGETVATSAAAGPILSLPAFTVQPSITGTPSLGATLTGNDGTIDSGSITARQWLRNGVAISGATGSTYTITTADYGAAITFRATATNGVGSTNATSAAVNMPQMLLQQAFAAGDTGFWYRPTDASTLRTAGNAVPTNGQTVATVLDQSGGGHHGTLPTPAPYALSGNNRGVLVFSGTQQINVPTALTFDRRALTLFMVINTEANSSTRGLFNTPSGATTTLGLHQGTSATPNGGQLTSSPVFNPVPGTFHANRSTRVLAVIFSGTERRVFDGRQEVTGAAATAVAAAAGAYLMRWNDGITTNAQGLLHEYAGVRRAMTAAEVRAIVDELAQLHGAHDRQTTAAGVLIGDSLTAGVFTDAGSRSNLEHGQHYGNWLVGRYAKGRRPKVSNFAQGGAHIRVIRDSQITAMNTELQRFADAGHTQLFLIVAGGTNDANGPTTGYPSSADGAALIQAYTDIFNGVTVSGVTKFAKTIPPRATFNTGWDTATNALNAWLRGGTSPFGTNIIDDRADSRLADPTNLTYYIADQLHFSGGPGGGHDVMGEIAYAKLIASGITGA